MNWWQNPLSAFRALLRKEELDADMAEEMRSHIEMQTQENLQAGMAPRDAYYAALRQFGWVERIKQSCRDQRGLTWLETFWQDGAFATRVFLKAPGFATVVVLSLALGVGATTAIYSVVNAVLLNPVPGPQPERLMQIAEQSYTQGLFTNENNKPMFGGVSPPSLGALGAEKDCFSDFAWFESAGLERMSDDFVDSEPGVWVSPNFFSLFQIQPLLGRTFTKHPCKN